MEEKRKGDLLAFGFLGKREKEFTATGRNRFSDQQKGQSLVRVTRTWAQRGTWHRGVEEAKTGLGGDALSPKLVKVFDWKFPKRKFGHGGGVGYQS